MIAIPTTDPDLAALVQGNPGWFTRIGFMDEAKWNVEAVNVPTPTQGECQAARAAVR